MSDSKGFSLRKKNGRRIVPKEAANDIPALPDDRSRYAKQEHSGPNGGVIDPRAGPRSRSRPGGTTSDFVKKRYSVRYAHAPTLSQSDVPKMPGVPKIPQAYGQNGRGPSPAQQNKAADLGILQDSSLQAEQVVSSFLTKASEQDIADYEKSLKKVKNRASTDLQHNVYQNRTQFIKISKEAEKLKTEMQTLRGLMSELTTTISHAALSSSLGRQSPTFNEGLTLARKKANRSSVANLEAMWNTQLQALWKNIEGSQKSLPAIPGRHIVLESGYWVELDAATWKPRRPVHIVLLNDHLLVAIRRRKRVDASTPVHQAPTKLVAEKCFPLQDIDMMDLTSGAKEIKGPFQETKNMTNSITIRHGPASFTYQSDRSDAKEKTDLLLSFKRTLDELRRAERADVDETGNKSKESMNYLVTRDPAISRSPDLLRSLSKAKDRPEVLIDVDGKQRNLRWVEGQIDELDIDIALQRFDIAVDRVEQLRSLAKSLKSNTIAQDLISVKLDERASKLAELLTTRLRQTASLLSPTRTLTSHLTRLSYTPLARATYLSARSAALTAHARRCVFEGDLLAHVTSLSYIYFTLIKNTIAVYQQCFEQAAMSAVVVWAKGHLDAFNESLGRGLSCVETGGGVWREALGRAREMAAGMGEVGVDFRGLVGRGVEGVEEEGGVAEGKISSMLGLPSATRGEADTSAIQHQIQNHKVHIVHGLLPPRSLLSSPHAWYIPPNPSPLTKRRSPYPSYKPPTSNTPRRHLPLGGYWTPGEASGATLTPVLGLGQRARAFVSGAGVKVTVAFGRTVERCSGAAGCGLGEVEIMHEEL
ncbi:exocyst complex component exo84 [Lambiella insularis]|nr:exocyst complex component exo84 [Lambiella insularis]